MAYRVENTGSADYQLAVGVSVPFNVEGVFNSVYASSEQIRSNLINYVLTNKGERYRNVNYGSDLRRYLFSNITDSSYSFSRKYTNIGIKDLEAQLKQDLTANFPELNIKSVTITPTYDTNSIQLDIIYSFMMGPDNQLTINI
jgi:phage baseplate assembly protein W